MRHPNHVDDALGALRSPPFDVDVHMYEAFNHSNQKALMVTQGNVAPDFTLETDRSEKVTLSKLRERQVVLFLPEGRHTRMQDRVQGQLMKAETDWAWGGSW